MMPEDCRAVSDEELAQVSGGAEKDADSRFPIGNTYTTRVNSGYLALRSSAAREQDRNIIGQLWNGSEVQIMGYVESDYVYVYVNHCAPGGADCTGMCGWVNWNHLE